jgi:hypothetical protein
MFNPLFGMVRFVDRGHLEEEVLVLAGAALVAGVVALLQLAAESSEARA